VAEQIVFATLEEFVFLDVQHDVEISRRAAFRAGIAFSGHPQLRARVHARRNLELEHLFLHDAAIAVTHRTPVLDDLTGTVARAGRSRDAEESLLEANLAVAVAGGACRRAGALLSAASTAFTARFMTRHFDLRRGTERRLFKRQFHVVTKIGAPLRAP